MISKKLIRDALISISMLLITNISYAGKVYTVDFDIGPGSVTGVIETDGTTGILSNSNIINWDLVLDDRIGSYNLLGPNSGNNSSLKLVGLSLTATVAQLIFDFSATKANSVRFSTLQANSTIFFCINCGAGAINLLFQIRKGFTLHGTYNGIKIGSAKAISVPTIGMWALITLISLLGLFGFKQQKIIY